MHGALFAAAIGANNEIRILPAGSDNLVVASSPSRCNVAEGPANGVITIKILSSQETIYIYENLHSREQNSPQENPSDGCFENDRYISLGRMVICGKIGTLLFRLRLEMYAMKTKVVAIFLQTSIYQ